MRGTNRHRVDNEYKSRMFRLFSLSLELKRYAMGNNRRSTWLGMGNPTFCMWTHMLREDLEVPSSEPKRKHEVVRFNGKSSRLGVRSPQVLLQLCC